MKLRNIKDVEDFLKAINKCKETVWLTSIYGDKFNMKSLMTQYVAIAALLGERGEDLELFCDSKDDELLMLDFFKSHPEILG